MNGSSGGRAVAWNAWLAPILTGIFVVTTSVAGTLASDAQGPSKVTWIVVQAVSALLAFLIPTVVQIRGRRRFREAAEARVIARTEMRLALNDALDPIVRHLGRIATAGWRDRERLRSQSVPFILNAATEIIGPDRARACWFALEESSPRKLAPIACVGRAGSARSTFVEGTRRGDDVLAMIEYDEDRFCSDTDEYPPPGWDPTAPHDYKTFVAVPVISGNVAYGMITLDAPAPGDLTRDDARLLRLLAGLLANAFAIDS
ncbi:MAG: GAF domain-containing protein [Streptosporangiales bacterium]|nr:GAF domain-containing protein [Streptosporangiales bacterium]